MSQSQNAGRSAYRPRRRAKASDFASRITRTPKQARARSCVRTIWLSTSIPIARADIERRSVLCGAGAESAG